MRWLKPSVAPSAPKEGPCGQVRWWWLEMGRKIVDRHGSDRKNYRAGAGPADGVGKSQWRIVGGSPSREWPETPCRPQQKRAKQVHHEHLEKDTEKSSSVHRGKETCGWVRRNCTANELRRHQLSHGKSRCVRAVRYSATVGRRSARNGETAVCS